MMASNRPNRTWQHLENKTKDRATHPDQHPGPGGSLRTVSGGAAVVGRGGASALSSAAELQVQVLHRPLHAAVSGLSAGTGATAARPSARPLLDPNL